jgi:2-iminobutanoate/2-iminopropanoate deaminase
MKRWPVVAVVVAGCLVWVLGVVVQPGGRAGADTKPSPSPPSIEFLNEDPHSTAPYSDAVRVGSMLYLAGVLGLDQDGKLVPGGIRPETDQALRNLRHVVEHNGSALDRVVRCTVMLADIRDREAMNEVYAKYFAPQHFPARAAFGTSGLYGGARVEFQCLAVMK